MSISPKTTEITGVDDPSWLGSAHGLDSTETITLDASLFDEETHYPDGYLPSGLNLAKVTATSLYGPYDADATDGREVFEGHLVAPRPVDGQARIVAAELTHGKVRAANLPIPLDAAGQADAAGRIRYI